MQLQYEHMAASSSPINGGGPRRGTASTVWDSQHLLKQPAPCNSTHVMPRPVLIDQHRDNDHRALNH